STRPPQRRGCPSRPEFQVYVVDPDQPLTFRPARRHVEVAGARLLDDHRHADAVAGLAAAVLVAEHRGDLVPAVVGLVRAGEGGRELLRGEFDDVARVLTAVRVTEDHHTAGEVLQPDVAVIVRAFVRATGGVDGERVSPRPGVENLLA